MKSKYIHMGPTADSVPYDNENDPNCILNADTVQEAIDELCVNNPAKSLISVKCEHFPCGSIITEAAQLISQTPSLLKSEKC